MSDSVPSPRAYMAIVLVTALVVFGAGLVALRLFRHPSQPALASPSQPALASSSPAASRTAASASRSVSSATVPSGCRSGNPLANVYHPARLVVMSRCLSATGVVSSIRSEPDGDIHFNILLDAGQDALINEANRTKQGLALVVELVPADRPGCVRGLPPKPAVGTSSYGICTGAALVPPVVGAHVRVVGPWVVDSNHGWNEIHPAWVVALLSP